MLQISPWTKILTALILAAGILIALPNALVMLPGNVLAHIPSWLPHRAEALERTLDVDIFCPPRADWLDGSDAYLRGDR